MKKNSRPIHTFLVVMLLVSLACNVSPGKTPVTLSQQPTQDQLATLAVEPTAEISQEDTPATGPTAKPTNTISLSAKEVYMASFAEYPGVQAALPEKYEGGYSLPVDLSQVQGMDMVELNETQKEALSKNGFVVEPPVPGEYREFYQIYEQVRYYDNQSTFVTTDAIFHIYHLMFDKMLRDLEVDYFIPNLETLTRTMLQATLEQYQAVKGTTLEEPALRNLAFISVADQILGLGDPIPPEAESLVSAELALINAHAGVNISPIWDRQDLKRDEKLIEDYSQYIPRGHYTRSEKLERYFKAMMYFGRMTYRLRDAFETRRALLMVTTMRQAKAPDGTLAIDLWKSIYEPTVFIVGKADDLSFHEYGVIADAVFGNNADVQAFADEALFQQFMDEAKKLPPPQVNSMWVWIWEDRDDATQGFRFMGQRFTLDAYVFGQLMWRMVGTIDTPRDLPKGLDMLAAMGSDEALKILGEMGESQYENYDTQMEKVRSQVSSLEVDSWTQNLYWSWLYAFQPVFKPKDGRYPAFMQTQAWNRKELHTVLGSWTELKHDTILYAKQVMAEMGGGGPETPPKSYVEPNPEAFARLLALSQMTFNGLDQRGLLSETTRGSLENLIDLITFLKSASEKELAGTRLTPDEYWRLTYVGGELEALTIQAADRNDAGDRNLEDQKAALVADVATGIGRVLEEAIGQPTRIYVILPDQPWRVAVGAVYTYYEFPLPSDQRMTDETWQAKVAAGDIPPAPDWTSLFLIP